MNMKRMLALVLSAVVVLSMFAACGNSEAKEDEKTTLYTMPTNLAEAEDTSAVIPEGWFAFATADKDNKVTVAGYNQLTSALGGSIAVTDQDEVTANLNEITDDGKIASITVRGNSIPVLEVTEDGVRRLYAKGSAVEDDPSVIDMTGDSAETTKKPVAAATVPATTKPKVTTLPPKASTVPTTKKPTGTKDPFEKQKQEIIDSGMSEKEVENAIKILSYQMDKNGIFYVEKEPWQKQFGFTQIYDLASPLIQLVYGTVRVKFRYDYVYKLHEEGANKGKVVRDVTGKPVYETDEKGNPIPKDWMVQMWKGRYGLVMLGGEIGIYTKPSTQSAEFYYSAVAEEEIIMAMDVYQKNLEKGTTQYLFTRGPESAWWLTGFVPGSFLNEQSSDKRSEVIMVGNLQFPTQEMTDIFVAAFEKAGFKKGSPGQNFPEVYTVSGKSVKFSWQWLDHDKKGG